MSTAIIPHSGIVEIVAHRDAAVAAYQRYFDAIRAAHDHLEAARAATIGACGGLHVSTPYSDKYRREIDAFSRAIECPDIPEVMSTAIRLLDIRVWGTIVTRTGLDALMDKQAKDELRKQMEFVPERVCANRSYLVTQDELAKGLPPVTVENVEATLRGFAEDADMIFKRGVANAFSSLDSRFKSHDGFKVGSRMILTGVFNDWGSWSYHCNGQDLLTDIERAFLVLDGKPPMSEARAKKAAAEAKSAGVDAVPLYVGIVAKVTHERDEWKRANRGSGFGVFQSEHEGDYFKVRIFQNGNAHLWFTRPDLVERVNRLLADYYGAALGYGRETYGDEGQATAPKPDPFANAVERAPAKNFGLYTTPNALANTLIEAASLYSDRRLTVLEPSAGTGQLARRAAQFAPKYQRPEHPYQGCSVTCVEIQEHLARALTAERLYARVHHQDFLEMAPVPAFDRIIMNPPFDRSRDLDHVNHALGFLRHDGILVAITSASARYGSSAKHEAFRRKVASHGKHRWTDLPAGSFAESGTNVNTCLLTVGVDAWVSL